MRPKHGVVQNSILVKRGKQVVKYWKLNGYALPLRDIERVHGIELYTKYDGILYAPRQVFYQHGIPNNYKGEEQLVLPLEYWEVLNVKEES